MVTTIDLCMYSGARQASATPQEELISVQEFLVIVEELLHEALAGQRANFAAAVKRSGWAFLM